MVAITGFPDTLVQMGKRSAISLPRSAGLLLVTFAWALFMVATGSPEVILFTGPVFQLAAPLALGRFPGEALIEKALSRGSVCGRAAPSLVMTGSPVVPSGLAGLGVSSSRAPPQVCF